MSIEIVPYVFFRILWAFSLCLAFKSHGDQGVPALKKQFSQIFDQADVVFLGEFHSIKNHKTVFNAVMNHLVNAQAIDTVAVEFVQFVDNDLLSEYLKDPDAGPGTETETQYFLRFSNSNRRGSSYASVGGWPILDISYKSSMRAMRRLAATSRGKVRFCGINSDQFFKNQFNEVNSDLAGFNTLSPAFAEFASSVFPKASLFPDSNDLGWGSGELRELRFAEGLLDCLKGSRKALVFTGAFHASQFSKLVHLDPLYGSFQTAADMVGRLTAKKVTSIATLTSSKKLLSENQPGIFGAAFAGKYSSDKFTLSKVANMPAQQLLDGVEDGMPTIKTYDYVITGPVSADVEVDYKQPPKPGIQITEGALSNIKILTQKVDFFPQLNRRRVLGKSKLSLQLDRPGQIVLQFFGKISKFSLNTRHIPPDQLQKIPSSSPMMSPIYIVKEPVGANQVHTIEVEFAVPSGMYTIFGSKANRFFNFESRFDNRFGIGPQWLFPSINLPTVAPDLEISIHRTSSFEVGKNRIFCACQTIASEDSIRLLFGKVPSQQFYFSFRPKILNEQEIEFEIRKGLKAKVLLNHFFRDNLAQRFDGPNAERQFKDILVEPLMQTIEKTVVRMEKILGPYPHGDELLLGIHPEYAGHSMEYRGATHTGLGSLVHEIIHQWIGTSLQPKSNFDFWFMEGLTTWLELKKFADLRNSLRTYYERLDPRFNAGDSNSPTVWSEEIARQTLIDRKFCPSAKPSEFCEGFSFDWYRIGPAFFDEIQKALQDSNSKYSLPDLIGKFFAGNAGRNVSPSDFEKFLKEESPSESWDRLFKFLKF